MSTNTIELALFPLDVVLFPGTVLPLHIFEPRYRQMITDCQREEKPFGIVLLKPEGGEGQENAYSVGTVAEIHDLDRLADGRYNLLAFGGSRFRIVSHHHEKPYRCAIVEPYEDSVEGEGELRRYSRQARLLFGQYLELLLESENDIAIDANLPDSAEELSHFIAYCLDIKDEQKQRFLELTSTRQRLLEEIRILRREVPFMREMLSRKLPEARAILN